VACRRRDASAFQWLPVVALATGEQALARGLLGKLAPGDLLLADRNFLSHGLLTDVLAARLHVLWRAKSDVDLAVLQVLPDGTYLSRIADPAASRRMRRKGADGKDIPGITVCVIEYSVASEDGSEVSETFTLVTDLLDPAVLTCEQAGGCGRSRPRSCRRRCNYPLRRTTPI
jgi:hypothetical protein